MPLLDEPSTARRLGAGADAPASSPCFLTADLPSPAIEVAIFAACAGPTIKSRKLMLQLAQLGTLVTRATSGRAQLSCRLPDCVERGRTIFSRACAAAWARAVNH
jgi:hypothetical protein